MGLNSLSLHFLALIEKLIQQFDHKNILPTMTAPRNICVYNLSPTYLPFHRYLYYTSLFLSVAYPTPPPFIKGAFAFSLTYSATASLYAILVISQHTSQLVNLDIFGLWSVISAACTLLLPLLAWNKNLNSSQGKSARSIVRIWGVWITIGMICTLVGMIRTQRLVQSANAVPMTQASCLAAAQAPKTNFRLRNPTTVEVGQYNEIFGTFYHAIINNTIVITVIPLFFGFMSCLITIKPARPKTSADAWSGICVSSSEGTFSLSSGLRAGYLVLQRIVLAMSPCFFIGALVLNERFLLNDWIPEAEEMYEVGQWGLLAGLGLVSAAAVVNWVVGRMAESVRNENKGGGVESDLSAEIIV